MHWWEETENRALRTRGPADLAYTLGQRLGEVEVSRELAVVPAYGLARCHHLGCDLIKLADGLLACADGDQAGARLCLHALRQWALRAHFEIDLLAEPLARLLDAMRPDADRPEVSPAPGKAVPPAEQAKLDGRFRHWHLLYERLDLKLAAAGATPATARGLGRELAETYEGCLAALRDLNRLAAGGLRHGEVLHLLMDLHAGLHFHLLPHHLGADRVGPDLGTAPALQTWLLLAMVEFTPLP